MGCRGRAARSDLVRVTGTIIMETELVLVVDAAARAPGRGAWLHPDAHCLELAERRHAFGRALRAAGPVDTTAVRRWFEQLDAPHAPGSVPGGTH